MNCLVKSILGLSLLAASEAASAESPADMVWIPGGDFTMGSVDPLARPHEQPPHRVRVSGFWMDVTEVTNEQFKAFVDATGYVTVAERKVDWEELKKQCPPGTPRPSEEQLQPGALVFSPTTAPVDLRDFSQWWRWVTGADWRHPSGPESSVAQKGNWPVVQVCHEDAAAYAKWAHKRLPTEAEWEYAARGGLAAKHNCWGDDPVDATRCNIWQGDFPWRNTAEDRFERAAPVKSFAPNGFGLYDMAGNVWEWCADRYRPDTYARRAAGSTGGVSVNPTGPDTSFDPNLPEASDVRVQRGGSFLCNDAYCASYRPSARMPCSADTALEHVGFRCVRDAPGPPPPAPLAPQPK